MMQSEVHDVIVIGSGASGGMAAWNLTRQGVNVLLLDAGTRFSRAKFWTHVKPWEWNAKVDRGERPPQFYLDTKEQPYDTPKGQPFDLVRVWGRGGKTNVWGRVALRYSDVDFGCNQSLSTRLRIKLPENFSVESLPQDVTLYKNDSTIYF